MKSIAQPGCVTVHPLRSAGVSPAEGGQDGRVPKKRNGGVNAYPVANFLVVKLKMLIMTKPPLLFLALLLLSLTACTPPSATRQYDPDVNPPPIRGEMAEEAPPVVYDDAKPSEAQVHKGGTAQTAKPLTPVTAPTEPPAVLALLQEADASSASGRLDNAAATLERAIRIQPRNALLWQKLAEVRLQQHQPGLAEDLAKKSNIYAKDNKALLGKNWSIIAHARREKGDVQGSSEAEAKARQ
jgi:tetratricopeptide (TPR) repeat protein